MKLIENVKTGFGRATRRVTNGFKSLGALLIMVSFLAACQQPKNADLTGYIPPAPPKPVVPPTPPPPPPPPEPPPPLLKDFEEFFDFSHSEVQAEQSQFDKNNVSVLFQAMDGEVSINDLKSKDLVVTENSKTVSSFALEESDRQRHTQVADIVFLVDVTTSMGPFIESAKQHLKDFTRYARKEGYRTRMCISTFGDYTVKKCDRFYENDPSKPNTEVQVKELLTELAALRAYKGSEDPGAPDYPENSMGALIDASTAPWAEGSLRFVILVTDADFLSSPNYQGYIGDKAPRMSEVTKAIKDSQMKVFAVTRKDHKGKQYPNFRSTFDGYVTPFEGEPSIVESSQGEHYDFDSVISGKTSLATILRNILNRISITYKLSYVVDQIPELDPTLRIENRDIKIQLKKSGPGEVKLISTSSSMPEGRPRYQKTWVMPKGEIRANTLQVYINNKKVPDTEYTVQGNEISFNEVPAPGSQILYQFYYQDIAQNFRIEPMTLPGTTNAEKTKVFLNDIEAPPSDLIFEKTIEGNTGLRLADRVLSIDDPYKIVESKGLKVKVNAVIDQLIN